MKIVSMSGEVKQQSATTPWSYIKDYWFLFVAMGSFVAGFAVLQNRDVEFERRLTAIEVKQELIVQDIAEIKENTATINARLEFVVDFIRNNQ